MAQVITASNTPIATIAAGRGIQLRVFPAKVDPDFHKAKHFFHDTLIDVEATYDSANRQIDLLVTYPAISDLAHENALKSIAKYYSNSSTTIDPPDVVLSSLLVFGYEIDLHIDGLKVRIGEKYPGRSPSPIASGFQVTRKVENDRIHAALVDRPETAYLEIKPLHLLENTEVVSISATMFSEAVTKAASKVAGGSGLSGAVLHRSAYDALTAEIGTSVFYQTHVLADADLKEELDNLLRKFGDELKPLDPSALAAVYDKRLIVYDADQFRLEMTPAQFKELTTGWETETEMRESHKKTWDKMVEIAKASTSESTFYKSMKTWLEQSADSAAKGGYMGWGGEGKLSGFRKDSYESLDAGERKSVKSSRDNLRNTGTDFNDYYEKAYEKWTGEKWTSGQTNVAKLNIHRVSESDIETYVSVVVTKIGASKRELNGILYTFPSVFDRSNWTNVLKRLARDECTLDRLHPSFSDAGGDEIELLHFKEGVVKLGDTIPHPLTLEQQEYNPHLIARLKVRYNPATAGDPLTKVVYTTLAKGMEDWAFISPESKLVLSRDTGGGTVNVKYEGKTTEPGADKRTVFLQLFLVSVRPR